MVFDLAVPCGRKIEMQQDPPSLQDKPPRVPLRTVHSKWFFEVEFCFPLLRKVDLKCL
jgi:hypothetical protein